MHINKILLLLCACIAFPALSIQLPSFTDEIQPRIIGGNYSAEAYPWIVSLQNNGHFCAGVLIHKDYVLTASHCLLSVQANDIDVIIGTNDNVKFTGGEVRQVDWLIIHPEYSQLSYYKDLAIIKLTESSTKTPIKLIPQKYARELEQNTQLRVMGWGITQEDDLTGMPVFLKEVDLSFQQDIVCEDTYGLKENSSYWSYSLCAGEVDGGKDSCFGDSGGPIVIKKDDQWHLIGLVSWGAGCGRPDYYGVYSEVPAFVDWINQRITGVSIVGPQKIGFLGFGRSKSENYRLINNSPSKQIINRKYIEANTGISFELANENGLIEDEIQAHQECSFTVDALGENVGEHNGLLTLDLMSYRVSTPLNSKVLAPLNVSLANLPWPFFSGTEAQSSSPLIEHHKPWYGVNEGSRGVVLSSGNIAASQRSVLLTYLSGPPGDEKRYLRFDAKVDSRRPDGLFVFVNEQALNPLAINSMTPHRLLDAGDFNQWNSYQIELFKPFNHLMFMYRKDKTLIKGSDRALLTNFRICTQLDQLDDSCVSVEGDYFFDSIKNMLEISPQYAWLGQCKELDVAPQGIDDRVVSEVKAKTKEQSAGGIIFYWWGILFLMIFRNKKSL